MTRRRWLLLGMGALLAGSAVVAQPSLTAPHVILLSLSAPAEHVRAFEESLRALRPGEELIVEHRSARGREDSLQSVARATVARSPDVIVAVGTKAALAARRESQVIPIVAVTGDMVAAGLVKDLGRPEGNVTGLSFFGADLPAKRLGLLTELDPRLRRLSVLLFGRRNPTQEKALDALDRNARSRGIDIRMVGVAGMAELDRALVALGGSHEEGVLLMPSPYFDARAAEIGRLTVEHRVIAMLPWQDYVEAGGLVSYAPDIVSLWRQAGAYVDRILRGAVPRDLPVGLPTAFELTINLKTAAALDLVVPESILVRADRLIE